MKTTLSIPLLLFLLLAPSEASAQNFWQATAGPYGGDITAIVVNSSGQVFAAGWRAGIFRSSDNGVTWTSVNIGLTNTDVYALAVSSTGVLFAGTSGNGAYRSTNNGDTWVAANTGLTDPDVRALAASRAGPVYAGTNINGVYRTTDNGATWKQIAASSANENVQTLALNTAGTIFAGTNSSGVNRSTDDGLNWDMAGIGDVRSLAVSPSGVVYAGTYGNGVSVSADNGKNWTAYNTGLRVLDIQCVATNSAYVFAGTSNGGIYRSSDNGKSWTSASIGLANMTINSLAINASGLVLAGTYGGGVYRSTDSGGLWSVSNAGLMNTFIYSLAVGNQGSVYAGTGGAGIFRTSDDGNTWASVSTLMSNAYVQWIVVNRGGDIFAGTSGEGVYRSTDNGLSWAQSNNGLLSVDITCLAVDSSNRVFAGATDGSVFSSTDRGGSWSLLKSFSGMILSMVVDSAGRVYAGTSGGGLYRSTDRGTSWTTAWLGLPTDDILCLTLNKSGSLYAGTYGSGVYRSTNNGGSWTAVNGGLSNGYIYSIALNSYGHIFAGTAGSGIFRSTDNGGSWSQVNTGLSNTDVLSLAIPSKGYIYAGMYGAGVYRTTLPTVIISAQATTTAATAVTSTSATLNGTVNPNGNSTTAYFEWGTTLSLVAPIQTTVQSIGSGTSSVAVTAPITGLTQGTTYYYRLVAQAAGLGPSTGGIQSFATLSTGVFAAPLLASPADGSTGVPTSPTVSWNSSAGAAWYQLQVSTNSTFSSTVLSQQGITGVSYPVSGLLPNTTYYWRVNTTYTLGTSGWSSVWSFTTAGVLAAPSLASPADGSTGVSTSPSVTWNATSSAISYRLQVSTDVNVTATVFDQSGITNASSVVTGLANNTTYYWRVRATYASGQSNWSNVWSFTTIVVAPAAPNLAGPASGATDQPISLTLSWSAVVGATTYRLQIDKTNAFTAPVYDNSPIITTSQLVSSLQNSTMYYWRVNATNAGGTSAYSNTYNFTTIVAVPASPALSAPANNATSIPTPLTLTWIALTGTATYHVQLSTNSSYSAPLALEDTSISMNSRLISNLAQNATYYWRVRGKNVAGYGGWSPSFSFSTAATKPVASPGVSFPSNPTASTDYRLVSFPGTSSLNVGQVLSGAQNADWRIFRDNGTTEPNNLTELSSSSSLSPGEGYWLVTKGTFNFSSTLTMPQLGSDGAYTMNVRNGWNIVGNPFDVPVTWSVVKSDNASTANLWTYTGTGGYQASSTLEPFKGYYFSSNSTTLKIRYPFPSSSVVLAPRPVIDWKLQIALETEGNNDSENYVGVAPTAKESLDDLDQPKPPRFLDQASLSLSLSAPNGQQQSMSSDFRPSAGEGQVWNFSISNPKRAKGKIRIIGIESVPPGYDVVLIDAQNTVPIDVRGQSEVSFRNSTERQTFNLIVGEKAFVQAKEARLVPKEFELSQNYPNPFNPSTTITYRIPREATVRLEIVSLLGQQLETLAEGTHTPGTYSVTWSTVDRHASSGVYFARLLVDGKVVKTQKMTFLK